MKDKLRFAELHCISNFSFLRGAAHPEELVDAACAQAYAALAMTDECSLAGVVRAHERAREKGLKLIIGTEIRLQDGPHLVLLARNRRAYEQICRVISQGRKAAEKGRYALCKAQLETTVDQCLVLLAPPLSGELDADHLRWLSDHWASRAGLLAQFLRDGLDQRRFDALADAARRFQLPVVASSRSCMDLPQKRPLRDLLTAIRYRCSVDELGYRRLMNAERHLRSVQDLSRLYPAQWIARSWEFAEPCCFSLDELHYQYPGDVTPESLSPMNYLRQQVEAGIEQRWPGGCSQRVRKQIEHELSLIDELGYAPYFLTVWDLVRFARSRGILCQGRGSAANSAVCYCLGITEVDPQRMNLLFERFISRERGEPPDIDVDFEHERREEVIQYIYDKYGRERAALAATVITYRPRSALRDVGKALGFSASRIEQLTRAATGWRSRAQVQAEWLEEAGFDLSHHRLRLLLALVNALLGFPRHLSQHVGGFVICQGALHEMVPVEPAAMPGRSIIQWDKDDLEALGMLKIDVLALGMLSAIRRCLELVGRRVLQQDQPLLMQDIPDNDEATYAMLRRADSVGVYQVESRAQMSMLPRLRPRSFYDLVVQVAIVRPGPIQGDMVHPYLRRRQGLEPVDYPSDEVREVLERTLGVPIFQEQVIKLTMVAAGFSPGEADQVRRSMAAWKRHGGLDVWRERLLRGMQDKGYSKAFAERIFRQIQGFGDYGFPESHAASFALLVYVSAWLKCHYPAAFTAALLNSQPMGFYAPAQLVRDAREHGVEVRPADVLHSDWDCLLEREGDQVALRLGLRLLKGVSRETARRISQARKAGGFSSIRQLVASSGISGPALQALAAGDALSGLSGHRYQAHWQVAGVEPPLPLLETASIREQQPQLPLPSVADEIFRDYAQQGLSLRDHPLSLLRPELQAAGILSAAQVAELEAGRIIRIAGLVLTRQRPGKGNAVFITLEDETGVLNLIVWRHLAERQRNPLLSAHLLGAWAEIQRADGVQHLFVRRLYDYSHWLAGLKLRSRDFH